MPIGEAQLAYFKELIHKKSAILLEGDKAYLVEARLSPIVRAEKLASIDALIDLIRLQPAHPLVARVVEAMTTNETSFFRDQHPFDALKSEILPALRTSRAAVRTLNIWSGASSTGQEAYSIAMLLCESFPDLVATWKIRIVGTDLSSAAVEKARSGSYQQLEVNRGLPAAMLVKYFERSGTAWTIKPHLRAMTEFRTMNLADPWPSLPRFDVVFLRNVLIYFDMDSKRAIFGQMKNALASDGYLFLGGAETTMRVDDDFERVQCGKSAYYRIVRK